MILVENIKNTYRVPDSFIKFNYVSKSYLIITAAHMDSSRNEDYEKSVRSILPFSKKFENIFLLECFSKNMEDLEYLRKYNIEIVISDLDNYYESYGINEFLHINNFLNQKRFISDHDTILKLTGRYLVKNNNLIKMLPLNRKRILAKLDGDIWDRFTGNNNNGVHTFYFAFKKIEMSYFIIHLLQQKLLNPPSKDFKYHIEWVLKDYISIIESKSEYKFYSGELGVETNFKSNGWKVLT